MTERELWLAERRKGIGGSDVASLFSIEYGCERRLAYDKLNTPPDFPWDGNRMTRIGAALEEPFGEFFAEETGCKVIRPPSGAFVHQISYLRVNLDFLVWDEESDAFVPLEIKGMGSSVWYQVRRDGLGDGYILQAQHEMLVYGGRRAGFSAGNRDNGSIHAFWIDRDEDIHGAIKAKAAEFWHKIHRLGELPDKLSPDDNRCQECQWRITCQGANLMQPEPSEKTDFVIMPQLTPLLDRLDEESERLGASTEIVTALKEDIKGALGDVTAALVGDRKVYHRQQAAPDKWDAKGLALVYQQLRDKVSGIIPEGEMPPPPGAFLSKGKAARPLRIY